MNLLNLLFIFAQYSKSVRCYRLYNFVGEHKVYILSLD